MKTFISVVQRGSPNKVLDERACIARPTREAKSASSVKQLHHSSTMSLNNILVSATTENYTSTSKTAENHLPADHERPFVKTIS